MKGYPDSFEYKVFVAEYLPVGGEDFDVAKWVNEFGKEGWQLIDMNMSLADSGMVTSEQKKINKMVMQALCMRGVFHDDVKTSDNITSAANPGTAWAA